MAQSSVLCWISTWHREQRESRQCTRSFLGDFALLLEKRGSMTTGGSGILHCTHPYGHKHATTLALVRNMINKVTIRNAVPPSKKHSRASFSHGHVTICPRRYKPKDEKTEQCRDTCPAKTR
jgi:hypothetical protein